MILEILASIPGLFRKNISLPLRRYLGYGYEPSAGDLVCIANYKHREIEWFDTATDIVYFTDGNNLDFGYTRLVPVDKLHRCKNRGSS